MCVCVWVCMHNWCLLREEEEILDGWKESESKRAQERKRCMYMISKADIRTPIRGQFALLLGGVSWSERAVKRVRAGE